MKTLKKTLYKLSANKDYFFLIFNIKILKLCKAINSSSLYNKLYTINKLEFSYKMRKIVIKNKIEHLLIPHISENFENFNDTFQVWKLERQFEGETPTNDFLLTCQTECPYLKRIDASKTLKIQYEFRFYSLLNIKFDTLKMYLINDFLFLPEEY